LRFYYYGKFSQATRQKINNAIALAEARSAVTCEICGVEGRLYRHGAWYMTRYTAHEKGRQVPAKPDRENLLISYGYEGGQLRVVACQRYDRATDGFTR
jgi:hypothetical protein